MIKYFILSAGLVSGLALGAGAALAEDTKLGVDGSVGSTITATTDDPAQLANTAESDIQIEGTLRSNAGVEVAGADLVGADVYDSNEDLIGEVAEILTDTNTGESRIVVDVGGFLGLGEHRVAVAAADLDIQTNTDGDIQTVTVLKTKAELEAMPAYES